MAVEKRWHYDLRFSPDTAKLYYNIENKVADDQKYDLNLNVKMIHAEGISFAKTLQFNHLTIKPEFTFYRSDYYQLGQLRSEEHTSELQSRPHLVCRLL